MGRWERGKWQWRRNLRESEPEGEADLLKFLQRFALRICEADELVWRGHGDKEYTVKEAYKEITRRGSSSTSENIAAPFGSKVCGRLGPLLKPKSPHGGFYRIGDNLIKRIAATQIDPACSCCKSEPESANNLFPPLRGNAKTLEQHGQVARNLLGTSV